MFNKIVYSSIGLLISFECVASQMQPQSPRTGTSQAVQPQRPRAMAQSSQASAQPPRTMAPQSSQVSRIGTAPAVGLPVSQASAKSPIIVLSIDGAAIRGIAQFTLLQAIEQALGEPITTSVDFFAGTSAGSVNVGAMLVPQDPAVANMGEPVEPFSTLDESKAKLPEALENAFSTNSLRKIRTLGGLIGSKYTAKDFEKYLQGFGGETRMSDLVKPAILTSYDMRGRELMNFSTYEACEPKANQEKNVFLWEAVRASSAAPTFYKPLERMIGGKSRALVDAGLFVMSPTYLALLHAKKMFPHRRILIISISSGVIVDDKGVPEDRIVKVKGNVAGGIAQSLEALIETSLEGQQILTDELMRETVQLDPSIEYYRLSFNVKNKEFDDTSPKNVKSLEDEANITVNTPYFKKVVAALVKARAERETKSDLPPFVCKAKLANPAMTVKKAPVVASAPVKASAPSRARQAIGNLNPFKKKEPQQ